MKPKARQLDSLTGLRFVAAFSVFAHHMANKFGCPQFRVALGALGVSFFFVLSGFILTYVYNGRLDKSSVKRFYFTRWARIWPLHFVTLLITLFYTGKWFAGFEPSVLFCNATLIQSWIPDRDYIFSMNGVAWSISTEMFFYFMFPILLLGGQKQFWFKFTGLTALIFATLFTCQYLSTVPEFAAQVDFIRIAHVNPFIRLFEFCAGMGIGFAYLNRKSKIEDQTVFGDTIYESIALAVVLAYSIGYAYVRPDVFVGQAAWGGAVLGTWVRFGLCGIVFSYAIYVFATRRGIWTKLLSCRTMVFLGEISFAFYMIHQIVIRQINQYDWIGAYLPNWAIVTCVFCICIGASVTLYKVVEIPCKAAMLKGYDGHWRASLGILKASLFSFFQSRMGIASVGITLLAMGILDVGYRHPHFPPEVREVVVNSPSEHLRVDFHTIARMKGLVAKRTAGGIELKIAWQKEACTELKRFVHICDANGKVLASSQQLLQPLIDLNAGDMFVDRIVVSSKDLAEAATVGIGFFTDGKGMGKLKKSPRTTGTWRYTALNQQEFAALISSSIASTADANPDVESSR